ALYVGERSPCDADAPPLAQERIRQHRHPRPKQAVDGVDVALGHHIELVPLLPEDTDEPSGLDDLDVADLVHRVAKEQVAREHRGGDAAAPGGAAGPRLDLGKEHLKALRRELIVHESLAMAAGPESVPGAAAPPADGRVG